MLGFPALAAMSIGWESSPFQWEVAMANLAFGLLSVFAFYSGKGFRKAVIIGSVAWYWGDALGHVKEMMIAHNFSPGNAGSWFWTDVLYPFFLILFFALWVREKEQKNKK